MEKENAKLSRGASQKIFICLLYAIISLLFSCTREYNNPFDIELTTPIISSIGLNEEKNIEIVISGNYNNEVEILLERKSKNEFEKIDYSELSKFMLLDTLFDKKMDHHFTYRVQVKKGVVASPYSEEKSIEYTAPKFYPPENFLISAIEAIGIKLEWKNISEIQDSLEIQKKINNEEFHGLIFLPSNIENYVDTIVGNFDPPLNLTYRIRAFYGDLSSEWVEKEIEYAGLNKPTNLQLSVINPNSLELVWEDNSSVENSYIIERKRDAGEFNFIDTVTANITSYVNIVSELGTYTYRVVAEKDGQISSHSNEVSTIVTTLSPPVSTEGMIAYWPFNGNANDESGNGNNGTVNGAILTSDRFGNENSAYYFDGVNDYINIGKNVKPPFPLSVSVWVKIEDFPGTTWRGIIRNDRWDTYYHGIAVTYDRLGGVAGGVGSGFSAPWSRRAYYTAPGLLELGNWHHIIVVFNSATNMSIYVDSIEYSVTPNSGTGNRMTYSSGSGAIGQRVARADDTTYGAIDDIRIYNRALSELEIQALYLEGN